MKFMQIAGAAALAAISSVQATSSYSPARPPSAPLAVKSPYLSTWLNSVPGGALTLPGTWPVLWYNGQVTGWQGFVRVDGTTYNWMGDAPGPATADQTAFSYTSTKSTFTINAGGLVELEAEFLSPIYPDDWTRQSITSSYLSVSVKSLDGKTHDVQLYADVSGEWACGDRTQVIQWEHDTAGDLQYHKFYLQNQTQFTETNQQANWGNFYWATESSKGVTYQIGQDVVVRPQFASNGSLANTVDTNYRAIDDDWPVFAFAKDLGKVSTRAVDTLFTIGYTQTEAILFQGNESSPQQQAPTYMSSMQEEEVVSYFYKDYEHAVWSCESLDNKVERDSKNAAGDDYPLITTLAARQVFGALQFTGPTNNPLIFQKEISSDGDTNTVDVLFPSFPSFVYFNHDIIKYALEPLLINQESGHYPNQYSMHDMGAYPQALGYPKGNDEEMPLEECGNMIIMMLAYAQRANDNGYLQQHWKILQQWNNYLVAEAKIPQDQLSTDDFAGHLANQTNLAIKGIIGIKAMSQVAKRIGNTAQERNYSSIASNYLTFWEQHGLVTNGSITHSNLAYNEQDTYGLLYNIFGDKVLNLGFIPQRIYDGQSAWYPTIVQEYGVILDTRNTWTKLDWEILCASVASESTRSMFISTIAKWINETTTNMALTDLYEATNGSYPPGIEFTARPVVGGTYAILALQ